MRLPRLRCHLCILEVVCVEIAELAVLGDLSEIHVGICEWLVEVFVFRVSAEGRVRVQLGQPVLLDVERRTHWAVVNLLRTTNYECSPVLFSLDRSDVEVTLLLQVYREDRLFLVVN